MREILDSAPISILLVEDEVAALKLLADIMPRRFPGVALLTATNGRTALELFRAHLPDIVITDINMPEMNGVQMAAEIRAMKLDTRFIVITGDAGKLLRTSIEDGFEPDRCMEKPVNLGALFAAVEECLGKIEPKKSIQP